MKRWYVQRDCMTVYRANGQYYDILIYVVEGPAPFGGTQYTDPTVTRGRTASE